MPRFNLSEQDLVDRLEEIAADERNRSAQLAAIKHLQVLRGEVKPAEGEGGFAELYAVDGGRR